MKSLLILRTHRVGASERRTIEALKPYFQEHIVIAADARKRPLETDLAPVIQITDATLDNWGLKYPADWGWRCGDFFFYAAADAYPGYSHYWVIEPDVVFNGVDPAAFFKKLDERQEDFLADRIGVRNPNWKHYAPARRQFTDVHGCIFPLVRLSQPAIGFLREQRMIYGRGWDGTSLYANDEGFVTSAILSNPSLSHEQLGKLAPKELMPSGFNTKDIFIDNAELPKGVLHPVLTPTEFLEKGFRKIGGTSSLDHYSEQIFRNLGPESNERFFQRAKQILTRRHLLSFNSAKDTLRYTKDGTAYPHSFVAEKSKPSPYSRALAQDFKLFAPTVRNGLDLKRMTPYASQPKKGRITFVDVPYSAFKDEPFMYIAQYEKADVVATVDASLLEKQYLSNQAVSPTLIFSMGRCGSTLSANLSKAFGFTTYSECEALRALPPVSGQSASQQAVSTVRAVIGALCAHSDTDKVVLKMRSQNNAAPEYFTEACPDAMIVFITRAWRPWAKSFVNSFDWSAEQIFENLQYSLHTITYLRKINRLSALISYEDMIADPIAATEKTLGTQADAAIRQACEDVMKADSQKGTLGRTPKPSAHVESILAQLERLIEDSPYRDEMINEGLLY